MRNFSFANDQLQMTNDIWTERIKAFSHESIAAVIGVFNTEKELVYANAGMKILLDANNETHAPADYLVNPNIDTLINQQPQDEAVFKGLLTAGNSLDISRTIRAAAYRKNDLLLIMGEYDVMELDYLNRQMMDLNQEINNLQRQLIKEKKMLEKTLTELRETQTMLIHSEKMNALGKLVAGIAHEINNPIAFVSGNLHSLKDSFSDISEAYTKLESLTAANNDMKAAAEDIREEHDIDFIFEDFDDLYSASTDGVQRVIKIVQDLRTFSRLDEGEIKSVDLLESIKSTLTLAHAELKKRNIEICLDFSDLPRIECYASELNQVFLNLIINACQAMENGGKLTISGKTENGNICLEFADTGTGISEDIIHKIFDPFFTTKPVGSGTGLGLSLAYKIITEKHKGSLTVKSEMNEGTVFTIVIPIILR